MDRIDEIIAAEDDVNKLLPASPANSDEGKIERIRFLVAGFHLPFSYDHAGNDAPAEGECRLFLNMIAAALAGYGLPTEAPREEWLTSSFIVERCACGNFCQKKI